VVCNPPEPKPPDTRLQAVAHPQSQSTMTYDLERAKCFLTPIFADSILSPTCLETRTTPIICVLLEDCTNSYILQGDFLWNAVIVLRGFLSFRGLNWKGVLLYDVLVDVADTVFLKILMFGLSDESQLVQSKAKLATEETIVQITIIAAIEFKRKIIVCCFLQCCIRKEQMFGSGYEIT